MGIINNYDVVIIGAGLAGIYTALNINPNFNVAILSKECIYENNSVLAQGGIAAKVKEDDEFSLHIEDTLKAGSRLNNLKALEALITEAPIDIDELIKFGVEFDKDESGNIKTTMEGGHSRRRILHAGGDATGIEVIKALAIEAKKRENIIVYEDIMAIDLIINDKDCIGVKTLYKDEIINVYAKRIVIATGGIGAIYKRSTNSMVATGDGLAMAYRAGCEINNMEFIQFHPTAFYSISDGKQFLISEAVRGEGAVLRNINHERFMVNYHDDLELAPRDIVSQSIYKEMKKTNSKFIYLDITHKDNEFTKNRFPTIYKKCLEYGIDITKDYIPVAPVEHYSIGGIKIDLYGNTNINNLYACGECGDSGVHGANRLASNSLLECLVFGRRVSYDINNKEFKNNYIVLDDNQNLVNSNESDIESIKESIKETMSSYIGIARKKSELIIAKEIIEDIYNKLVLNYTLNKEYIEVLNMATVSRIIINACINRNKSIGCHLIIND